MSSVVLSHATALLLRSRLAGAAEALEAVADDLKKFGAYTVGRSPRDLRREAARLRADAVLLRPAPVEPARVPANLSPVELTMFRTLERASPAWVASGTLAQSIWGNKLGALRQPHTLATRVHRLRRKLALAGSRFAIESTKGLYRLTGGAE